MIKQPIDIQRTFMGHGKTFIVYVNGKLLTGANGQTRRFGTEIAAECAAVEELGIGVTVTKAETGNETRALKIFRTMTAEQHAEVFARIAADSFFPDEARRIAASH